MNEELRKAIRSLYKENPYKALHQNKSLRLFRTVQQQSGSKALTCHASTVGGIDYHFSYPLAKKGEKVTYRVWYSTSAGMVQLRIGNNGVELVDVIFVAKAQRPHGNERVFLNDYFVDVRNPTESEVNLLVMTFPSVRGCLPTLVSAIPVVVSHAIKTYGKGVKL